MINHRSISMLILFAVILSGCAIKSITILPLGDSITEGGAKFTSYRQDLISELHKKKLFFKFVGPKKDKASAHAGYSGKNTAFLLSQSKSIYSQYPADIVMFHSGHNSYYKDKPVAGIVRDTEHIIKNIHRINPEVVILLGQVIHSGKLPKYSYIPELNKQLKTLSKRLVNEKYKVTLVDHAKDFNWKTDTISDKVHPNAQGARKMTKKWLQALLPLLSK